MSVSVLKILPTTQTTDTFKKTQMQNVVTSQLLKSTNIFHSSSDKRIIFEKATEARNKLMNARPRAPFRHRSRACTQSDRFPFKMAATLKKGVVCVQINGFLSTFPS